MERGEADQERGRSEPGEPIQAVLPLDLDAPIPFELTARARRAVAPASLPPLEVVAGPDPRAVPADDDIDDPSDMRPARARALRRAGMSIEGIASELDVSAVTVADWTNEVGPVATARRRLRAVDGGRSARPADLRAAAHDERARQRFEQARQDAKAAAPSTLADADDLVSGLGLLSGTAHIDAHAVTIRTCDRAVAVAASHWLRRHLATDAARFRVILRIPPQVAGDVLRRQWADELGVPLERVTTSRWRSAPDAETVEATLRLADPDAAGRLAGWRDQLLSSLLDDADRQ